MRKKVLRLLRSLPLALLFAASVASAQTTGTIIGVVTDASTGKPVAGALVVATSPNMQGEQTAVTDATGNFRLTLLPPGAFKLAVQLEGYKPGERTDINLRVDKTLRANLTLVPEAVQMEEQVVRTGVAPVINVGSAETGTVVTKEFIGSVPVGRDFSTAALVAPGTQTDARGVTFFGASSPENGFILDGLNVADPAYGTQGSTMLNNFAEEIDVKTGSYMAEYGRSTSGVVNMVTKSGSNEFHGSLWGNYTPGFLRPSANPVLQNAVSVATVDSISKGYNLDLGGEVGGPIMKDKLWFYAGIAPVLSHSVTDRYVQALQEDPNSPGHAVVDPQTGLTKGVKIAGTDKYYDGNTNTYQFFGKLTYLIDENNSVVGSLFLSPGSNQGYATASPGTDSSRIFYGSSSNLDGNIRYAGKFLNKHLIVEAQGGVHHNSTSPDLKTIGGIDQGTTAGVRFVPTHSLSDFESVQGCDPTATFVPCPVQNYTTGGFGYLQDITVNRISGKLSVSGLFEALGHHTAKGGLDAEEIYYDDLRRYSGGNFLRELNNATYGTVYQWYRNFYSVDTTKPFVEGTNPNFVTSLHNKSVSDSYAFYLQDSWSILDLVTLNAGLRWEIQNMRASQSAPNAFNIKDNLAPRLQAIYDFTGQGRSKISANWGRYYEMIPLDMSDRSFNGETAVRAIADHCVSASPTVGGTPATCAAIPGSTFDPTTGGLKTYGNYGSSTVPVAPDLKGQYSDQFGAAVEYEVLPDMSVVFSYTGTRVGRVIEDMSTDDGNTFFIANPSESKPFIVTNPDGTTTAVNPRVATTVDPTTLRKYQVNEPVPERKYDGFTLEFRKNFSKHWLAQASYTYSSFRGNYPGLIAYDYQGQLDPNITAEYDILSLLPNRYGPLNNDRPHQFKLFGAYTYDVSPRFHVTGGGTFRAQSGTPISITGAHDLYGNGMAFILPRGYGGRSPFLTQVDLRGVLEYTIQVPYTIRFSIDILNVLNQQQTLTVDGNYTFDFVRPIVNGTCASKNGAEAKDPVAAVQADCPDLKYLRTIDGRSVSVNPNYGRATSYSAPLSMRFGLAFTF